jgi:predicted dehydrogenase
MSIARKIKAGIIGIGNWGRYGHVPSLQLMPSYEIAAVSSRRKEAAGQMAQDFGAAHAFTDPDELIRHPDVDLVIVLPPAPQHAQYVRAAIAAGKDVYCEWPLTTTLEDTEDLLRRAQAAGVRHAVGLQRRMGPSVRYVRDLLARGYVGQIRSVRMHVSMNYFQGRRSTDLAWTIPPENFSHILSIYGGHFMDMLFHVVGAPETVSAVVTPQFENITLIETGETFPNQTPDQVLAMGTLARGGVFTIQIEGGKRNNSGLQIDITGMEGDLKISNPLSFTNRDDNKVEGSQGNGEELKVLPVPASYRVLPESKLDASVLDLAYLYAAFEKGHLEPAYRAPDFADAVKLHKLIDVISKASDTGTRQIINF